LTGSLDGTAILWDVETGRELQSFGANAGPIRTVSFSPDGLRVLTADDAGARIWDPESGTEIRALEQEAALGAASFASDPERVVTVDASGAVRVWDPETGLSLRTIRTMSGARSFGLSRDGRRALLEAEGCLWLLDLETGDLRGVMEWGFAGLGPALSADGKWVVTAASGIVRWDSATARREAVEDSAASSDVVAVSADGRWIASATGRDARVWDVTAHAALPALPRLEATVSSLTFSADARVLVAGTSDGRAVAWDVGKGRVVQVFAGRVHRVRSTSAILSARNEWILTDATTARKVTLTAWDLATGQVRSSFLGEGGAYAATTADGRRTVRLARDGSGEVRDAHSGDVMVSLRVPTRSDPSLSLAPDGATAAVMSGNEAVLVDLATGRTSQVLRHEKAIVASTWAPDSGQVVTVDTDGLHMWDRRSGARLHAVIAPGLVGPVVLSPDGGLALTGSADGTARVWDLRTGLEVRRLPPPARGRCLHPREKRAIISCSENDEEDCDDDLFFNGRKRISSAAFSPGAQAVVLGRADGSATLWEPERGRVRSLVGHRDVVSSVVFSVDGRRVLTASRDGTSRVWDSETASLLATLMSFGDGSWAVIDPSGRYDASKAGDVEALHWVLGTTPIALSQMKERYYEPGLLSKLTGFNPEPLRDVEAFATPKLFPRVVVSVADGRTPKVRIQLENRGGGLGKVRVLLNGKELAADARGPRPQPADRTAALEVLVPGAAIIPGQENTVEVVAWNAEGYLSSRGVHATWRASPIAEPPVPELYGIVVGTSRYASPALALRYPGKDAADFAAALRVAGARLFGAERVHVTLLSDDERASDARPPAIAEIRRAFSSARAAKPGDVLVVFLAGHGTTAPDGEYWYLTREARTADLADPAVRALSGVSSSDLTEFLKANPATKQVMVLDTCAAGAALANLANVRALPSEQRRAIERMKDRTGLHVLMGSAADAVSYEASRYGQGLLTYALLEGVRGAALREETFVDVAKLFAYAQEEVPRLAGSIGGIQHPEIAAPRVASFDIGMLTPEDKRGIPLAAIKPLVMRAAFQNTSPPFNDGLGISRRVNAALRDASDPSSRGASLVYVDAEDVPGGLRLTGRYHVTQGGVTLDVYLLDGESERAHFEVSGSAANLDEMARTVVAKAEAIVPR
jgi:WD40 repeat protein